MLHVPGLHIAASPKGGRGVFCAHEISKQDTIEICPIIFIPAKQLQQIDQTIIHDYYFLWPDHKRRACIALGYGSLYNHSPHPNASVTFDLDDNKIIISCLAAIGSNQEILIDYTGGIKNADNLWFDPK